MCGAYLISRQVERRGNTIEHSERPLARHYNDIAICLPHGSLWLVSVSAQMVVARFLDRADAWGMSDPLAAIAVWTLACG